MASDDARYTVRAGRTVELYMMLMSKGLIELDDGAREYSALLVRTNGMVRITFTKEPEPKPAVVTLCGSVRFRDTFAEAAEFETLAGRIVLSVGCTGVGGCKGHTDEEKTRLDELHKRKIDLSDEILVLNVGGYVGESTRAEIEYAQEHGKRVRYWEVPECPDCGHPGPGCGTHAT